MSDLIKGFRDFLLRGNIVDLAVAVIIGAAFGGIVSAFSKDFIGGIIGIIGGSPDFGRAGFTINGSKVIYGSTLTAAINFVIVAAAVYFAVVVPMAKMMTLRQKAADTESPAPSDETVLLTEIRDVLKAQSEGPTSPPKSF